MVGLAKSKGIKVTHGLEALVYWQLVISLPPVGGQLIVGKDPSIFAEHWNCFKIWTMTDIMRQQNDQPLEEMLNCLRIREQSKRLPQQCLDMLRSRVIASPPLHALNLFPFRKAAARHNIK